MLVDLKCQIKFERAKQLGSQLVLVLLFLLLLLLLMLFRLLRLLLLLEERSKGEADGEVFVEEYGLQEPASGELS